MARHLGMWPAVEACSTLIKEQEQQLQTGRSFTSASAGTCQGRHQWHREGKGKKGLTLEDNLNDNFSLTLDASDESFDGSPRRNLRRMPNPQGHNGLPLSPSHRMKLMDFKSPSSKKASTPRQAIASLQSPNYSPISPSNARVLRSSPGAAKAIQRFLPMPESPRRNKKPHSITCLSRTSRSRPSMTCSPVRVKQEVEEVGEDEEDYARAQEKYKLMNVLGLQRTALLPRPEDLIGWRQKKRLRKLKANNYSLTKRRKPRSTSPGLPYGSVALSLPLCNPVNTRLLSKSAKTKTVGPVSREPIPAKKPKTMHAQVPPNDRSMRSKGVLPDLFQPASRSSTGSRELRRSVRRVDGSKLSAQKPQHRSTSKTPVRNTVRIKSEPVEYSISGFSISPNNRRSQTPHKSPPLQRARTRNQVAVETVRMLRYNSSRPATKNKLRRNATREVEKTKCKPREDGRKLGSQGMKGVMDSRLGVKGNEPDGLQLSDHAPPSSIYSHPLYKVIKEEPAEPVPVVGPFPDPPSPDLGKRQSKPPIKLLDSGFLFSFCRPAGGPMTGVKKEEESVDICLTRSVSQVGDKFGGVEAPHRALRARGPPTLPIVKREKHERRVSQNRVQRPKPKSHNNTLHLAKSARSMTTRTKAKVGNMAGSDT